MPIICSEDSAEEGLFISGPIVCTQAGLKNAVLMPSDKLVPSPEKVMIWAL